MLNTELDMSSLSKASAILACFTTEQTDLSVSYVSEKLALPKSSVSRLMKEMAELGLLQRGDGEREYGPGYMLFQLGAIYQMRFDLIEVVDRIVRDLVKQTGCTGYIGLLDDGEIVAMRKHLGTDAVRYRIEVGRRYPVTYLSFGKALLSRRSDTEIMGFFTKYPKSRPANMKVFLAEIAEIRAQGWAEATKTSVQGAHGIGVAVISPLSRQQIGYSLSFHADLMGSEQRREVATALVNSARQVATLIMDDYWQNV
ncbi:IclR family transcriptional regulator [Pseudooceanicola nanhaiensis]|uniref:IclR family transcriptional regulator n=1 Tax=Pseudooceanicola nanhaiensis TaxID=375761 RepID=UPI001CD7BCE4|nr:helix-turn-helix domain-containing protein [Pseudooceanicola nanhaiensis]MCA0918734.1 helix-turn-helix domain-containing protein [Pseudooceanicola nanhaiensis]